MIEVILVAAAMPNRSGVYPHFVEIKGIPHAVGSALVVTGALPLARAEEVKRKIEDALDAYRRPKRKGGRRRPKTAWERLIREPV